MPLSGKQRKEEKEPEMSGETAGWTKGLGAGSRKSTGMESGEGGRVAGPRPSLSIFKLPHPWGTRVGHFLREAGEAGTWLTASTCSLEPPSFCPPWGILPGTDTI